MKKLCVLMLVLGLASLANAQLQISVHNNPAGGENWDPMNPEASQITLLPGQTLLLDIWTTTDIYSGVGEGYFVLGVLPSSGTLAGGNSLYPDDAQYYSGLGNDYLPNGEQGDLLAIGTFRTETSPITGTLVNQILFTCAGVGDAVINLYETDWTTPTLLDSVTIHQIPEPMTITLLGLGGLLLRRRMKKTA